MKQFLVIFSASLFLLSCQNQSSSKWTIIKFVQSKPNLVHLNLGDSAHGQDDGMAFGASIKDISGVEVGEVLGW
jgi:hypothetical protein